MDNKYLKIGLPAGSLANPKRGGNLLTLLENSGFKTSGYESGGPSTFKTFNYLFGWDGRPQEFGSQLGIGELDVAIAGDDWIKERVVELKLEYGTEIQLDKVLSLKRGDVRIVGIIDQKSEFNDIEGFLIDFYSKHSLLTIVSEMPYLALDWIQKKLEKLGIAERFSNFSVQKYKTPAKIDQGILIYETWGKTEAKVKNCGANLGMEITQSGSALRNYGLKIIDTVMLSETGIWVNSEAKMDTEKSALLRMLVLNLYGSVNAENKVMILFNVPNSLTEAIERYLAENNLFADEPTINSGKDFTEYSIQVDISDQKNPLAKIRYDLAMLKAKNIDTLPIQSSIPGIDVLRGI
ncbi:MAG: hypothetical protein GY807_03570 [Gammaproteobacteria bacterium]|nr:hypothetical protein [Gammaproteobacteria bacterium]